MHSFVFAICLLLCGLVPQAKASFDVLSPSNLDHLKLSCYKFKFLGDNGQLDGFLNVTFAAADPWDACSPLKKVTEGSAILFGYGGGCVPSVKVKNVQKAGGVIAIMLMKPDFQNEPALIRFQGDNSGINIPVLSVVASDNDVYHQLQKYTDTSATDANTTTLVMISTDKLENYNNFFIPTSIFFGIFAVVNFSLGWFRLHQIWKSQLKFHATLPEVCLFIEVAANLVRFFNAFDPAPFTGWGVYNFLAINILQWFTYPWTFSATLLIAVYWNRALDHYMEQSRSSSNVFSFEKWKIPVAILCFCIISGSIVVSVLNGCLYDGPWFSFLTFVLVLVFALISLYFVVVGFKILRFVKKTAAISGSNRFTKICILVVISNVAVFIMFLGLVLEATLSDDASWQSYYFCCYLGLNLLSFSKVIIFEGTQKESSESTGGVTASNSIPTRSSQIA